MLYTPVGEQIEPKWLDFWFKLSREGPTAAAAQALRSVAVVLRERAYEMSALDGPGAANSRSALEAVAPHVAYIRDMLIARLIDFDEVPELVERMLAMTDAEREWSLQVAFSEKGDLQEIWVGWDSASRFFDACADVVAHLVTLDPSASEQQDEQSQKSQLGEKRAARPCAGPPPDGDVEKAEADESDPRPV
jgi:sarcosine oxidase delta subunit